MKWRTSFGSGGLERLGDGCQIPPLSVGELLSRAHSHHIKGVGGHDTGIDVAIVNKTADHLPTNDTTLEETTHRETSL